MHRAELLQALSVYERTWAAGVPPYAGRDAAEEGRAAARLRAFVAGNPGCFDKGPPEGHVTGSALVTDAGLSRVLLTLHAKLGRWLQLGGHSDGEPATWRVALREAREESGLRDFSFAPWERLAAAPAGPWPFDLDVHEIPARKGEPAHLHFDVRYLLVAAQGDLVRSDESHDLRWFPLAEARAAAPERSMIRQFDKVDALRAALAAR